MTLSQRRLCYFPGNVKLTLSVLCKCDFEEFPNVKYHDEYNEFEFDINDFKNSKKDSAVNFNIIKCASLIFNTKGIKGIKDNYGSYFILGINLMIFIYYILLICYKNTHIISLLHSVSYDLREKDRIKLEKRLKEKDNEENSQSINSKKSEAEYFNKEKTVIKRNKEENNTGQESKDELKEKYKQNIKEIISQKDGEIQSIIKSKEEEISKLKSSKRANQRRSTKIKLNDDNVQFELQPQVIDINNNIEIFRAKNEMNEGLVPLEVKFSNEEINNMDFQSSLAYDKRNICDIYGSYLNEKALLIFYLIVIHQVVYLLILK